MGFWKGVVVGAAATLTAVAVIGSSEAKGVTVRSGPSDAYRELTYKRAELKRVEDRIFKLQAQYRNAVSGMVLLFAGSAEANMQNELRRLKAQRDSLLADVARLERCIK